MVVVIFEVKVKPEGIKEYLQLASELRNALDDMDGFISVERFTSLTNEGKLVSLSFWESEEAVSTWRNSIDHKRAQQKGRFELFIDYRIRVAKVLRDYGSDSREQALE